MAFDLNAFERVIDPNDNATGGGAASAVAGAMAAGLVGMVARLSRKKPLPEYDHFYETINTRAMSLTIILMKGSNEDSLAFDRVMAAFRMSKETEAEKAERSRAIQSAWAGATETPLKNAEACAAVLDLADQLLGNSNQNAASDLECAIFLANAGLKGALSNAAINIASIKDPETAAGFQERHDILAKKIIS